MLILSYNVIEIKIENLHRELMSLLEYTHDSNRNPNVNSVHIQDIPTE